MADISSRAAARYVDAVQDFVRVVLDHGRDPTGRTPLFVDGVHGESLAPPVWKAPDGREMLLSNFASQQNLLRILVGLSRLGGNPEAEEAARSAASHVLSRLVDPSGLLYWGGHCGWDLWEGRPHMLSNFHELKSHYPFYEFLFETNPKATAQLIRSAWARHILDWDNLDMNRHGEFGIEGASIPPWPKARPLAPVGYVGKGLSVVKTGSDLFYAGALLHVLAREPEALEWSLRMAGRYDETRHPETGLTGYQYSRVDWGDRGTKQFGPEWGERFLETTILDATRATRRYATVSVVQLLLSERLGAEGAEFGRIALDDLLAFARHAYDSSENRLRPLLIDGLRVEPAMVKREGYFQPKTFIPYAADGEFFRAYSLGYRLSTRTELWDVAVSMARGNGLGNLEDEAEVKRGSEWPDDPLLILGLLDLYRATGRDHLLKRACGVADSLLVNRRAGALFTDPGVRPSPNIRFDRIEPLALLHLAAALLGRPDEVPVYPGGVGYLTAPGFENGRFSDYKEIFISTRGG